METNWDALKESIEGGYVSLIIAYTLMILVMLISRMWGRYIPPYWRPLVTAILGVITSIASTLVMGVEWYYAIGYGMLVSTSASGSWSLFGKYIAQGLKLRDYGAFKDGYEIVDLSKQNDKSG